MTRLTGIILENFKAFKHRQIIPIRPLTLIYGPNSAGKSSIIHALALLRHAFLNNGHAEADPVELGWSKVRLGGWQNLVHVHDGRSTFKIGLQFETVQQDHETESDLTDNWEVVWEFGRPDENSAATAIAITALRNGQPEFDGTWNRARHCWSLARYSNSLHPERLSAEQFFGAYLKQGGLAVAEEAKPPFREWLAALRDAPLEIGGLFPGSQVERKSEWDEYHEGPPSDEPDLFLRHLFHPVTDDGSSYNSGRDWTGAQAKLVSGIEKIKAGERPADEETDSLHEVYEYWSRLTSECERPYEFAALSFEAILRNHFHLDPVRERPKFPLNLRDLPDKPKYRLWRRLILDEGLREQASNALEILTRQTDQSTGYQLTKRNRIVEIGGNESSQSIKSITPELSILNPPGLLLGIEDVGYGISTILPIVTAINHHNECMISVEQPELHIHPRLQTELGELFVKSALGNKNTLLIETHSEHLIRRVLRRVRETTEGEMGDWPDALHQACPNGIYPNGLAVIYVKPSQNGAEVIPIRINELGEFVDEWPGGFFEERFDESL